MSRVILIFTITLLSIFTFSCSQKKIIPPKQEIAIDLQGSINHKSNLPFDSSLVTNFFQNYPDLAKYREDVVSIYRKYKFQEIWFDEKGVLEFGNSLYSKIKSLDKEGISTVFPYQNKINGVFEDEIENTLTNAETDLMLTSLFLFYTEKVVKGVDEQTSIAMEWLLPRKEVSYETILDSVMLNPKLLVRDEKVLFRQYYKLRDVLQKYREIEKQGGWQKIEADPKLKAFKPGDTAKAILQIREHLYITGDISQNNGSNNYDTVLVAAIRKYQKRNGKNPTTTISPALINYMNIPVGETIKKIIINMERCRWISPEIIKSKELVFVNIPSFKMLVFRDGVIDFESPVVVGKTMSKTVVFSGNMSYIVFSPYWVLPKSIINSEVKPGMAKNENYLEKHNMEWNDGQVRQKPGKNNSLGQVKFLFPNTNNIYLHDTPSKSHFARESRAFSHGCIRVGKPRELAINLLKDDPAWTPARIDAAMNSGNESWCTLKNKIPVYIAYFTVLVNQQGEINFYEDVYKRDERLYSVLIEKQ